MVSERPYVVSENTHVVSDFRTAGNFWIIFGYILPDFWINNF